MAEHTPTPWVLEDSDMLFAKDGRLIGDLRFLATPDHRATGAFIVKAVNNHEALVKHLHHLATVCCDEDALRLLDSLREDVGG